MLKLESRKISFYIYICSYYLQNCFYQKFIEKKEIIFIKENILLKLLDSNLVIKKIKKCAVWYFEYSNTYIANTVPVHYEYSANTLQIF